MFFDLRFKEAVLIAVQHRAKLVVALSAAACLAASQAGAAPIASESFWVDATAYSNGQTLQNGENNTNGNSGFSSGNTWSTNTGTMRVTNSIPSAGAGLTHVNLVGSALDGAMDFRVSHDRNATRLVDPAPPTSSTYYLSGLVRANGANAFAVDGDYFARGFGTGGNIGSGIHLGIRRNDSLGGRRLTAFAGNTFFDLGAAADDTTHMIIVSLSANAGGSDSLTAWIDNGTTLTEVVTSQSVETFTGSASLVRLALQQRVGDANQIVRAWGDEIRFGTEMSDVYVPEPGSLALLGLGGLLVARRRR